MILNSRASQWGGAAFILGNVLFLVNKLNEMSRLFLARWMPDVISGQDMLLIVIGQAALIIGYVCLHWCYVGTTEKGIIPGSRSVCFHDSLQ